LAATGLRVTAQTPHGDRDVKRASVDFDLEALAVPDPVARRGRNSATVTGIGQGDLGQVAQSMRDRDGYPAHDDTRAGTSAGGAELRWYCRQIPANGLIAATPGQYIPLFFQAGAGMSIALGIPVKLASDLVAVRHAPVCWQQIEQRALVLVGLVLGPSHAKNLAGHPRQIPAGMSQPAPPSMPLSLPGRNTDGTAVRKSSGRRGSRPVARSDVVVELELVRVRDASHFGALECPLSCGNTLFIARGRNPRRGPCGLSHRALTIARLTIE